MKYHSHFTFSDIIVLLSLYFAAIVGLNDTLNFYALYAFIPLAFIITLKEYGFKQNKPMKQLSLLYAWIIFTAFFAHFPELTLRQLRQMLGCYLFCYTLSQQTRKPRMVPWLYGVFIVLLISVLYYGFTQIITSSYSIENSRMDDATLNANTIAYFLLNATVAVFILGDICLDHITYVSIRILFILMIPISFWMAIFTASRQIIITMIPLFLLLLYSRYMRHMKRSSTWVTIIVISIMSIFVVPQYASIYNRSNLRQRTEIDIEDDSRSKLLEDAFKVGMEHPVVGVGPGNYIAFSFNRHMSHCTYTELFANCGLMGFLLYAILVVSFLWKQWRLFRKTKDDSHLVFFIFGIIYILDNIFFVFYQDIWLISFFILVASHAEEYNKRIASKNNVHIQLVYDNA